MRKIRLSRTVRATYAAASLLVTFLQSCDKAPELIPVTAQTASVRVSLSVGGEPATKSSLTCQDDVIASYQVMAYNTRTGILECSIHSDETQMLRLLYGQSYRFYAVANMDRFEAPQYESGLQTLRLSVPSVESVNRTGLPMAYDGKGKDVYIGQPKLDVTLDMTRLVSRYTLRIDKGGLSNFDYHIDKVQIKQAALDITPFTEGSVAQHYGDWDCSSDRDIISLNEGESVSFYTLENCRGVLLPDNGDPWAKVPSSIGEASLLCTYITISGLWSRPMVDGVLTYNLYLGQDATSDFNIIRNTSNDIVVELQGYGSISSSSWKVQRTFGTEGREIYFEQNDLTLWSDSSGINVGVVSNCTDSYEFEYKNGAFLQSRVNITPLPDGGISITPIQSAKWPESIPTLKIGLYTWDRVLFDELRITMKSIDFWVDNSSGLYDYLYNDTSLHEIPFRSNTELSDIDVKISPDVMEQFVTVIKDEQNGKMYLQWKLSNMSPFNKTATISFSTHDKTSSITTTQGFKIGGDGIGSGDGNDGGDYFIEF